MDTFLVNNHHIPQWFAFFTNSIGCRYSVPCLKRVEEENVDFTNVRSRTDMPYRTHAEKCSILPLDILSCRNPWLSSVITIYGVACVQLAHFNLGDWKDVSITHVIIIIKSEVSTFPIVIIFFRGCVPEMFVTSYSVTYCIYMQGKPGFCLYHYCAVYDECK